MKCTFLLSFVMLIAALSLSLCQDIDVEPLFPTSKETTTSPTSAPTVTVGSTTADTTENVETPLTTEGPFSTLPAVTSIVSEPTTQKVLATTTISTTTTVSTSESSTLTSTQPNTTDLPTTQQPTTPQPITQPITASPLSETTTAAGAVTTRPPPPIAQPLQRCYYRKQQSLPQFYWTCEGPKWLYSLICYECCQFENAAFAGCSQVHFNYCEQHP